MHIIVSTYIFEDVNCSFESFPAFVGEWITLKKSLKPPNGIQKIVVRFSGEDISGTEKTVQALARAWCGQLAAG